MDKTKIFEAKIKPLADQILEACELYDVPAVMAFNVTVAEGENNVHVAACPVESDDMPEALVNALKGVFFDDEDAIAEIDARYGSSDEDCCGDCRSCNDCGEEVASGDGRISKGLIQVLLAVLKDQLTAVHSEVLDPPENPAQTTARLDAVLNLVETAHGLLNK